MYWRDIATLVGVKKTVNENGYKVETEARREVFVNKEIRDPIRVLRRQTGRRQNRPRPRGARLGL